MSGYLVHLAAPPIRVASVIRQRCAWCGALIDERDLDRMGFALAPGETVEDVLRDFIADDGTPVARWEGLVGVATGAELEGGRRGSSALWAVEHPEDGGITADSCLGLPVEATR